MAVKPRKASRRTRAPPFSHEMEAEMSQCADKMRACVHMQEELRKLWLSHSQRETAEDKRFAAMYSSAIEHLDRAGQCLLTIALQ
jgi:hypothetical protein